MLSRHENVEKYSVRSVNRVEPLSRSRERWRLCTPPPKTPHHWPCMTVTLILIWPRTIVVRPRRPTYDPPLQRASQQQTSHTVLAKNRDIYIFDIFEIIANETRAAAQIDGYKMLPAKDDLRVEV